MTNERDKGRNAERPTGQASSADSTRHTGSADPNKAADIMKDRERNKGGLSTHGGADTDGAGTGGMVEGKDAGGGPAGTGGSSGSAG